MKKIKYLLLIILSFVLFIPISRAEVTTFNRVESENFGINKKWQITDSTLQYIISTPYVDASEKIYDFAEILTDEEEKDLYDQIEKFRNKYKTEIIIYTVNKPYTYDKSNEDWATDFYDFNDFGIDFDKYDGILIYRNAYAPDPYYDIYTFGTAQLYFGQARYDELLDNVYNEISGKLYLSGFSKMIRYINSYYTRGVPYEFRDAYIDDMGYIQYAYVYHAPVGIAFIVAITVTIISTVIMVKKNKMVQKASSAKEYLDLTSVKYTQRDNIYLRSTTSSYTVSSSSGGGSSGGGHSSGGHSGGGHSSGGGRHG